VFATGIFLCSLSRKRKSGFQVAGIYSLDYDIFLAGFLAIPMLHEGKKQVCAGSKCSVDEKKGTREALSSV
jgi:hypothetical protein